MPIQDQLYYLALGSLALLFDNALVLGLILIVLVILFVVMLCRMARQ